MDSARSILTNFDLDPDAHLSTKQYDAACKSYVSSLGNLSQDAVRAVVENPSQVLAAIDPGANSIGFLAVIDTLKSETTLPAESVDILRDAIIDFLIRFDPYQIRYTGLMFRGLLETIASGYHLFTPTVAVTLIANAILRVDPSGTMFTSTHLCLARLAYDSNCMEPALSVLDKDILFYPKTSPTAETKRLNDKSVDLREYISPSSGLTRIVKSADVLEYQLVRSLIYISRKDWSKAHVALEQIISHPCKEKNLSKIMIESHKKWVLVGLLNQGRAPILPSNVSGAAKGMFHNLNQSYISLADAFTFDQIEVLRKEVETEAQTWRDDGNATLVAAVLAAYQSWQILGLRDVYQQVTISKIRNFTVSAETGENLESDGDVLTLISEMIASGMLKADLHVGPSGDESYLEFKPDGDAMTEAEFAAAIARSHRVVEELSNQYRKTNERFSRNKDYIKHLMKEARRSEREGADAAIGFDAQIEDEDLMTGVMSHT